MTTYNTYKDSGIAWLGQIPSHWEVKRLGSFFNERRQKVSDKDFEPLSVTKLGIFPQWENVAKTNDGDNRKLVRKGDFVINSRSDRKGSSGVSELDGSVSLINIVLSPKETVVPAFCDYLLKCNSFIEEYYRIGRGIVADLWTTRYQEMKCMDIAMPPIDEQEAIVNYLKNAIAKIDEAIAQQQKMIDLLKERKQIIINEAVTHGLDPNVPMKPTGIDWLPQIPAHWEIYRIKNILSLCSGDTMTATQLDMNGPFNVYGGNGIRGKHNKYNRDGEYILIGRVGALCGNIHLVNEKFWATEHALIGTIIKQCVPFWLSKILEVMNLGQYSQSTAQPVITQSKISSLYLPVPPMQEQKSISDYILSVVLPIDKTITQCKNMIELLTERKQIIINNVVTGKIKVS